MECILMARRDIVAQVVENREAGAGIFRMVVTAPEIAQDAWPGQFCMVTPIRDVTAMHDPLLRRPLSIHDAEKDKIAFLYRVAGRGTMLLSAMKQGESIKILGPLGNGFKLYKGKRHVMVGGGLGIAPMLLLARKIALECEKGEEQTACGVHGAPVIILGAAGSSELACLDQFRKAAPHFNIMVATEDGSMGFKGLVTPLLEEVLSKNKETAFNVMTCGPFPMMHAVAALCSRYAARCQVSLEARMACGSGLCLGCAVPSAGEGYLHVCREGPVFDSESVKWN